jgi:alkylation response protein AidB-like acyl-CoA dehydrogenase
VTSPDATPLPRDFGFGPDEAMLRDIARKFLDEELPVEKLRRLVAGDPAATYERGARPPWDASLWRRIAELGWSGLAVPEAHGGLGIRMAGIAGLIEEVGRHALPSPLVATLDATFALRSAGAAAGPWLARIADGASASLAIADARGSFQPGACDVRARADAGDLVLSGAAHFVQDAFKADLFVTTARAGGALLLCVIPADAAGVELAQDHIHDLTRDQATVRLRDVRVPREGVVGDDAAVALCSAWPAVLVTASADLCGTSEWQLQTTVEYARQRKQFDRQLGFFQAVKHPLVDAMVAIDRARSLLYHAASCIDAGSADALRAARMAKSAASDAGAFISDRSVQLHGGIGFTWECDIHLFFKRSLHNHALYGDGVYQRSLLADMVIGPRGF